MVKITQMFSRRPATSSTPAQARPAVTRPRGLDAKQSDTALQQSMSQADSREQPQKSQGRPRGILKPQKNKTEAMPLPPQAAYTKTQRGKRAEQANAANARDDAAQTAGAMPVRSRSVSIKTGEQDEVHHDVREFRVTLRDLSTRMGGPADKRVAVQMFEQASAQQHVVVSLNERTVVWPSGQMFVGLIDATTRMPLKGELTLPNGTSFSADFHRGVCSYTDSSEHPKTDVERVTQSVPFAAEQKKGLFGLGKKG